MEDLDEDVVRVGDGMFGQNTSTKFRDLRDGTTNTVAVCERASDPLRQEAFYSAWAGVVPDGEEAITRVLGVTDHPPNTFEHPEDFQQRTRRRGQCPAGRRVRQVRLAVDRRGGLEGCRHDPRRRSSGRLVNHAAVVPRRRGGHSETE